MPLFYLLVSDPILFDSARFFHGMATAILGPVVSALIAERFSSTKGERIGQHHCHTLWPDPGSPCRRGTDLIFLLSSPVFSGTNVCILLLLFPGL